MESVMFFYPKNKNGKPTGHSIAILLVDGKPFVGFAQLSKGDNFSRKVGRQIAESRARDQYRNFKAALARRSNNELEASSK